MNPDDLRRMNLGDRRWLRAQHRRRWRALTLALALVVAAFAGIAAFAASRATGIPADGRAPDAADGVGPGADAGPAATPAATAGAAGLADGPTGSGAEADGASRGAAGAGVSGDGAATGYGAAAGEPGGRPGASSPPIEWAAATDPSPVAPVPDSARVPRPDAVHGIYVGAWSMGNARRLARLVRLADETEVNAFVIDVKDVTGEVSYATQVPLAVQVGATRRVKIGDMRGVLDTLRAHRIYPIARIVVFKDPLLAEARPEWSITRDDGSIWEDNNQVHWVDSFNPNVWDYNIELAREAIALGFSEVQWDYIRFPDVPHSYMVQAVYPARDGRTKVAGIRDFMLYTKERLADLRVPVTADVFGITTSTHRDVGIGQVWEQMADVMDVLLPMVYPSHYPDGSFGYDNPNAAPYQIVKRAMDDGVERSRAIPHAARIRPWLQAFTLGDPPYGPREIRAQIDAVYAAGLDEWILWHPGVRYPQEAFATASGIEPWFAGMGEALYMPEPDVPVETHPVNSTDTTLGTPVPMPSVQRVPPVRPVPRTGGGG